MLAYQIVLHTTLCRGDLVPPFLGSFFQDSLLVICFQNLGYLLCAGRDCPFEYNPWPLIWGLHALSMLYHLPPPLGRTHQHHHATSCTQDRMLMLNLLYYRILNQHLYANAQCLVFAISSPFSSQLSLFMSQIQKRYHLVMTSRP